MRRKRSRHLRHGRRRWKQSWRRVERDSANPPRCRGLCIEGQIGCRRRGEGQIQCGKKKFKIVSRHPSHSEKWDFSCPVFHARHSATIVQVGDPTGVRHSICSHAVDVSHRSLLREDVEDDKRDGHVGRGHCVAILGQTCPTSVQLEKRRSQALQSPARAGGWRGHKSTPKGCAAELWQARVNSLTMNLSW